MNKNAALGTNMDLLETFSRRIAYPLWDWKDRSSRLGEYRRMVATQYADKAVVSSYQLNRLRRILAHASETVPHYRKAWPGEFRPASLATVSDLRRLPILTKGDIRSHTDELISEKFEKAALISAKTGGSTGVALSLYFDKHCQELRNAAAMVSDSWAGWKPGMLTAALWGSPEAPKTFKEHVRNILYDRVFYLDTMRLDQATVQEFCERLNKRKPKLLFGHAHSIYELARFVDLDSLDVPVFRGIVATSMMLLKSERDYIEQVLDVPVTNRYGCEEVGLIASECEEHDGLHLNSDHVVTEFVNGDGEPARPGDEARILLTDLNNYGMPLIRYEVGDVGMYDEAACKCGRAYPMLRNLIGRTADYLLRRDGSKLSGISMVEKTLTAISGLEQLQIMQESVEEFRLNAVITSGEEDRVSSELGDIIRGVFGAEVSICVNLVETLQQESNGKYRFAIRKF